MTSDEYGELNRSLLDRRVTSLDQKVETLDLKVTALQGDVKSLHVGQGAIIAAVQQLMASE